MRIENESIKIKENKEVVGAELREEFAKRYEHDKANMIEAIDKMMTDKLSEEITKFVEDRKALAQEKIVYLDLDYILSNSNKGKNILSDLDKKNNENIKILKSKEEILKIEEENLLKQKNIISNEAYNKKKSSK